MHDKNDGVMVISNVKNSCTTMHMYTACINNCKSVIEQGKMKMVDKKDQDYYASKDIRTKGSM